MINAEIRQAVPGDIDLIVTMIRELAEYEKISHEVSLDDETLKNSLFEKKRAYALIIERLGEPIGYCIYFYNFSTFLGKAGLYIEDIYIRPQFRGNGTGGIVFEYLKNLAKSEGCGRMEWACLDWNESAISFYKKKGAKPLDEWLIFRMDL